jgi:hypothetical protein
MSTQKKFVIKQFKHPSVMDKNQANKTWESLQSAIDEIYEKVTIYLSNCLYYLYLCIYILLY